MYDDNIKKYKILLYIKDQHSWSHLGIKITENVYVEGYACNSIRLKPRKLSFPIVCQVCASPEGNQCEPLLGIKLEEASETN